MTTNRTPTPWAPCAGATVPDVPEGMALEVESYGMLWLYKTTEETEPWFGDDVGRYRLIPWPMTPREKFARLAEALGDGFRVHVGLGYVCVDSRDTENRAFVGLWPHGVESHAGPRDFNRRALALLDQLQIGRDDVAAMVGGKDG